MKAVVSCQLDRVIHVLNGALAYKGELSSLLPIKEADRVAFEITFPPNTAAIKTIEGVLKSVANAEKDRKVVVKVMTS